MKTLIMAIGLVVSCSFFSGIYEFSLLSMDGTAIPLTQFQGRKLLIVVLPATSTATDVAALGRLDSLSRIYQDKLTVIGLPCYDGGFTDDSLQSVRMFYNKLLGSQIILAKAVYASKTFGSRQNALFTWLTSKGGNGHFDADVKGAGQKFFISGKGELTGVFDPRIPLTNSLIQRLVNQP